MNFSHTQITHIPPVLSEQRFATYLKHSENDKASALRLYQWNLELSSALLIPLHLFEISIRNAVVDILDEVHTSNWPWTEGFIRSLPNPKKGANQYNPSHNLRAVAAKQPTSGKVVAELNFIFWEKMFTARHDCKLWNQHLLKAFPCAPEFEDVEKMRKRLHKDISDIRALRNRIAHHEPIFTRNISADYKKMRMLIEWRDTVAAQWMDDFERVNLLISQKPQ